MNWKILTLLISLSACVACAADNAFFAMDTGTKDAQHQTAEAQVALVKEIGFAGIGPIYSTPAALREMLEALDRQNLKLFAEYVGLDLDATDPVSPKIQDAISQLKGRGAVLWLYITSKKFQPSDPSGDQLAVPVLRQVAELAEAAGVRVALYPHAGFWVGRVEDAVRLARQVERKNLGVTFNLCHWLKVDGKALEDRLEEAKPYLFVVTINGADTDGTDWRRLIQPLDGGSFDVSRVLAKLKQMGYRGPIGLQHFGIGGDARKNLQRSMVGWQRLQGQDLQQAGRAHPDSKAWADLFAPDLSNAVFPAGVWSWKDGELSPKDKDEAIWSKQDFENFILDLEFKLEPAANSGVFVCDTDMNKWITSCVEIQILDDSAPKWAKVPPTWKCGGIFGHSMPKKPAVKKAGEWNRMTIRCQGAAISVLLNGELVTGMNMRDWHSAKQNPDGSDIPAWLSRPLAEMATKGRIGLQGAHGGIPTHFRNLKIKPIE